MRLSSKGPGKEGEPQTKSTGKHPMTTAQPAWGLGSTGKLLAQSPTNEKRTYSSIPCFLGKFILSGSCWSHLRKQGMGSGQPQGPSTLSSCQDTTTTPPLTDSPEARLVVMHPKFLPQKDSPTTRHFSPEPAQAMAVAQKIKENLRPCLVYHPGPGQKSLDKSKVLYHGWYPQEHLYEQDMVM